MRAAAYRLVAARFGALVPYICLAPTVWIVAARGSVGGVGKATVLDGGRANFMTSGVMFTAELWRDK